MSSELSYRFVPKGGAEVWVPVGGEWRTAASNWIVVHDAYHHQPGDIGTVAQEFATMGAEFYVCHEQLGGPAPQAELELPPPGWNALSRSAAGIVGVAFDSGMAADGLTLSRAPTTSRLPVHVEAILSHAANSAVDEFREILYGNTEPVWVAAYAAMATPGLLLGWMAKGYWDAKTRFPDQGRVQSAWADALCKVQSQRERATPNSILTVRLSAYEAEISVEPLVC